MGISLNIPYFIYFRYRLLRLSIMFSVFHIPFTPIYFHIPSTSIILCSIPDLPLYLRSISVAKEWIRPAHLPQACVRLPAWSGMAWRLHASPRRGCRGGQFHHVFLVYKVKIDMDWYGLMWVNHHVLIIYVFHSFSRAMFNSQRYRCFMICNTK